MTDSAGANAPAAIPTMPEPTLFALSSGVPPAAIAIIRITGTGASAAIEALAGRLPAARRATMRELHAADGTLLDRALVLWFPGPATATGEDLAELHLHGGRAVIAAVLDALAALPGLAPAPPGAFTRRAFANGRIDLTEAEGLADLLAADSEFQRRQALQVAEGGLRRLIEGWRTRLLDIAAMIEAAIDYADEGDVIPAPIGPPLAALRDEFAEMLAAPPAERMRDGVRVILAGPVNAGKSSLLNALAGRSAAIVSDVAGTTRDLVEVPVMIDGMPILLIDSAGLRASGDPVEQQGVERARAAIDSADILLWLDEASSAPRPDALLIAAKSDLGLSHKPSSIPVSAFSGEGLSRLRAAIVQRTKTLFGSPDALTLHARHRTLLRRCLGHLDDALVGDDAVLIAEHIRTVLSLFEELTGRAGVEDMLDALFTRFCVGK